MRLPPLPDLDWTEDGAPIARAFNDIYFSREGGLSETRTVFLEGCGLPEAWAGRSSFVVGELGFGSGLNALALWRLWRDAASPGGVLHLLSIEGFLMPREAAARALAPFPEVADLAAKLLARWPARVRGSHRIWFPEDRFCLTVVVDDVELALSGYEGLVDCWFLDGFAPSRNPGMWTEAVMRQLAACSAPGARLSTYSVAAAVRSGLTSSNFSFARRPGFGSKRERLEARWTGAPAPRTSLFPRSAGAPARRIAIIGSGVAGASIGVALRRRGVSASVFDAAAHMAAGASGNPVALVMPRLDRSETPLARFFRGAYLAALDAYEPLGPEVFAPIGVREPARAPQDRDRIADFLADPPLPPELLQVEEGALFHPRAGTVRPRALITRWLEGCVVHFDANVRALSKGPEGWTLDLPEGAAGPFDAVVLAAGPAIARFAQSAWLPLSASRGQIDFGPVSDGPSSDHAIASGVYCAPLDEGLVFGATFDRVAADAQVTPNAVSTAQNLDALDALAPELAARLDRARLSARAAIRASTPDRAPFVGLAPDARAFAARFAGLAHGRAPDLSEPAPVHDGLFLVGGFGARGFLVAPQIGEILASELLGEPSPLDRDVRDAVHPARFLVRALKKGQPIS